MTNQINDRRNGKYTCLDCKYTLAAKCKDCVMNNWNLFDLDLETIKMTYAEKNSRYESRMEHDV